MSKDDYTVMTHEPMLDEDDPMANCDALGDHEPPPCPLCGGAYVRVLAHDGPYGCWLECSFEHCIEVHWDEETGEVESCTLTDKPRRTMGIFMRVGPTVWKTPELGILTMDIGLI